MDEILTTVQIAELMGVSCATVIRWIKQGQIPSTTKNVSRGSGCGYKVYLTDLNDFIRTRSIQKDQRMWCAKKTKKNIQESRENCSMIDKESMRIAAANLRIAIEFAQEELSKIEKLL